MNSILQENLLALRSWRIWWHMGLQDLRNQFRRSRIGAMWVLINLALMAGGIGYIYGHLFHQDLSTFFPQLILGLVLWTFISSSIVFACNTFIVSEGYIKQFPFPKQIYILRFFLASLVNMLLGLTVYFAVAYYVAVPLHLGTFWALPGLMLTIMINLGHAIIFAYMGTKIRDLAPALSGIFMILFYVTPIIFTAEMLSARGLDFVYQYNPLFYLIEIVRYPLLHGTPAATAIYTIACTYGLTVWYTAIYIIFKYDRKVAYWL